MTGFVFGLDPSTAPRQTRPNQPPSLLSSPPPPLLSRFSPSPTPSPNSPNSPPPHTPSQTNPAHKGSGMVIKAKELADEHGWFLPQQVPATTAKTKQIKISHKITHKV